MFADWKHSPSRVESGNLNGTPSRLSISSCDIACWYWPSLSCKGKFVTYSAIIYILSNCHAYTHLNTSLTYSAFWSLCNSFNMDWSTSRCDKYLLGWQNALPLIVQAAIGFMLMLRCYGEAKVVLLHWQKQLIYPCSFSASYVQLLHVSLGFIVAPISDSQS